MTRVIQLLDDLVVTETNKRKVQTNLNGGRVFMDRMAVSQRIFSGD